MILHRVLTALKNKRAKEYDRALDNAPVRRLHRRCNHGPQSEHYRHFHDSKLTVHSFAQPLYGNQ
jgi:hypothetical protein